MTEFMIAYHGGRKPDSEEEGKIQMGKWKAWIENLGEKIINPGTPLTVSRIVTSDDVEDNNNPDAMKGFAIVKAGSLEEAIEIAKSDPFLENGGTIRLSQMMQIA